MTNACKIFCVVCLYANKICKSVNCQRSIGIARRFSIKKIPKLDLSAEVHEVRYHHSTQLSKCTPNFNFEIRSLEVSNDSPLLKIVKPFNCLHNVRNLQVRCTSTTYVPYNKTRKFIES